MRNVTGWICKIYLTHTDFSPQNIRVYGFLLTQLILLFLSYHNFNANLIKTNNLFDQNVQALTLETIFINNQNYILSFDCFMLMLQVIKMLVLIVVVFIVCWAPILILDLLTAFHVLQEHATGTLKHIKTTFHLMSYFNRQVNFVYFKSLKCLRHFIQKITKVMV